MKKDLAAKAVEEDKVICTASYDPSTIYNPVRTKTGYGNVKNGYLPDPSILFEVLTRSKTIKSISISLK